jgi:hypothetical protein
VEQPEWVQVTQTRTALLRLLHCGETFTSITGEAALRLAFLVVFQGGGVAKKCVSSERRGLVIRPRCSDEKAETSRLIKAGVAGGGWERVDGEYKVDVGWLSVVQAKGDARWWLRCRGWEGEGKRWTGGGSGGTISKQRPEGLWGGTLAV